MKGKFNNINTLMVMSEQEQDNDNNSGPDSPSSSFFCDMKVSHSPKRSKRGVHKRVVSVPIKEVEGSRSLKGENTQPPSDSWAWRKYGQKPIKGSPYPRGYYRCSSSKGCPARKQVERSRVDPNMLVVTYSCEHNHPWPPPSRTHPHSKPKEQPKPDPEPQSPEVGPEPESPEPEPEPELELEEKFTDLRDESLISNDHEFGWFGHDHMETTSTMLESPFFTLDNGSNSSKSPGADADEVMFFPMGKEDELLFADLGELPECSTVFRHHRGRGPEVQIC